MSPDPTNRYPTSGAGDAIADLTATAATTIRTAVEAFLSRDPAEPADGPGPAWLSPVLRRADQAADLRYPAG